jgi:hypothetical protein
MIQGYEFKGIKFSRGHEGEQCAYGNFYKGKVKVAEFAEDTWGGGTQVKFISKAVMAEFVPAAREYLSKTLDVLDTPYDLTKMTDEHIASEAVERLSYDAVEEFDMRKACAKGLVFRVKRTPNAPTELITANCLFTERNIAELSKDLTGEVEVVNRRFGQPLTEGTPEYRAAEFAANKAKCRTKTLYVRLINGEHQIWTLPRAYSPAVAKALRDKHADLQYIINEQG